MYLISQLHILLRIASLMNKKSTCIFNNIFFLIFVIKKPNIIAIHYLYKYKMSPYMANVELLSNKIELF